MGRTRFYLVVLILAALAAPAGAQVLSNATLNGAYYFRYLGALTDPSDSARSFLGTITFDGAGRYTVTGQGASGAIGGLTPLNSGSYYVGPGGIFNMTNPVDSSGNTFLYGGVGVGGIVVASSTDTLYCDTFVAFPASSAASNATLNGNYTVASLEFLNGQFGQTRDTFFSMTANGSGSLGNVTIKGTAQNLQSQPTTQTSTGATYTVNANGSGTMTFPAPGGLSAANTLLSGNKTLYVSADGSLFIAGSPSGFDMVIGIKSYSGGSPNSALSGLYFTTLLENFAAGGSADGLYGAGGSSNMLAGGIELGHQRTNPDGFASYEWTFSTTTTYNADGTFVEEDFGAFGIGADGRFLLGAGDGTNYQLTLYVKAAPVSGGGVFLNPQAIVNSANNIPFTAQVSPGAFIDLYGSGLAGGTATAGSTPFPTTLADVQVLVNGAPAPLYYVSPTRISLIVPYSAAPDVLFFQFQVRNAGTESNIVEAYHGITSPGIFTIPPGGLGGGAILRQDSTVLSESNPARPGETIQIFMTGLGRVDPAVDAGVAGPVNPLSRVVNPVSVFINGAQAPAQFAGLAPQLAGLYQVNVILPANAPAGDVPIQFETRDALNFQATVRVAR